MAKAYIIADLIEVSDPEGFGNYREKAVPTVGQYGGKALIVDGKAENLEGDWAPPRLVMLEFDSPEAARAWYDSREYTEARPLRHRSAQANMILVEGL